MATDVADDAGWLAAAAAVGVLSSVIPYALDQWVLRRVSADRFAVLLAILPATATLIGLVSLGQVPSGPDLVGIAFVTLGVGLRETARSTPAPPRCRPTPRPMLDLVPNWVASPADRRLAAAAMGFGVVAWVVPFLVSSDTTLRLTQEDGPYEMLGAIAFAVAGVLFGALFVRTWRGDRVLVVPGAGGAVPVRRRGGDQLGSAAVRLGRRRSIHQRPG